MRWMSLLGMSCRSTSLSPSPWGICGVEPLRSTPLGAAGWKTLRVMTPRRIK